MGPGLRPFWKEMFGVLSGIYARGVLHGLHHGFMRICPKALHPDPPFTLYEDPKLPLTWAQYTPMLGYKEGPGIRGSF